MAYEILRNKHTMFLFGLLELFDMQFLIIAEQLHIYVFTKANDIKNY